MQIRYHLLAPGKIGIKKEMLANCQLKIADLYNISIDNVKKLAANFFGKEKCVLHYEILQILLETRIKTKKICRILEFNQSQWVNSTHKKEKKQQKIEAKIEMGCTN